MSENTTRTGPTDEERRIRLLGQELEAARREVDRTQEREARALSRIEGLVRALDLLAQKIDEVEADHDDTIAELRQAEGLVRDRAQIADLLEAEVEESSRARSALRAELSERLVENGAARARIRALEEELESTRVELDAATGIITPADVARLGTLGLAQKLDEIDPPEAGS